MYSIGFGQPPHPHPRPHRRPHHQRFPRQIPATGPLFWYDYAPNYPASPWGPSIITAETTHAAKPVPGLDFLRAAAGFLKEAQGCKSAGCVRLAASKATKHLRDYIAATQGQIQNDLARGALGYLQMAAQASGGAAVGNLKQAADMIAGQIGLHEKRVRDVSGPVEVEFTPW